MQECKYNRRLDQGDPMSHLAGRFSGFLPCSIRSLFVISHSHFPTQSHRERGSPHWSCTIIHIWVIYPFLNGEYSQRQHSIFKAFPSSGPNRLCQLPRVEMVMTDINGGVDQGQLLIQEAVTVGYRASLEVVGLHVP